MTWPPFRLDGGLRARENVVHEAGLIQGRGATVIVISPPDVSLTGSAYDFTRGLGVYLGPGLACRAAPGSPPPGAAPFAALPSDRATPSRRPDYRSESEPAWAEVGAARRARASDLGDILLTRDA